MYRIFLRRGEFTDEYKKTIGVDFLEKRQYVESLGEDVKLMVWDTAGQEEFDSITRTYYRGDISAVSLNTCCTCFNTLHTLLQIQYLHCCRCGCCCLGILNH